MKAFAIAGHYGYDDGNDYGTGLHRLNDFNKTSNPNYQIGYIGAMVAASVYFGDSALDTIFKSFIFDDYLDQFSVFKFTSISRLGAYSGEWRRKYYPMGYRSGFRRKEHFFF